MSLRFFADHCVPSSVIQMLQEASHEVLRLRDHIPPDSSDQVVIAKAQELNEWVPRVRYLQEEAGEVHLLFNTNYQDQGVVNARKMASLLGEDLALS